MPDRPSVTTDTTDSTLRRTMAELDGYFDRFGGNGSDLVNAPRLSENFISNLCNNRNFRHLVMQTVQDNINGMLQPINDSLSRLTINVAANSDSVSTISTQVSQAYEDIDTLTDRINSIDQARRAKNLIFSGIEEHFGERLGNVIASLVNRYGIRLTPSDIEDCFRLGQQNQDIDRPRPVLVKLYNLQAKKDIYALRNSMFLDNRRIMLSEDLCRRLSELHYNVRQACRQFNWVTWTMNGTILVRTAVNTRAVRIGKALDLDQLIEAHLFQLENQPRQLLQLENQPRQPRTEPRITDQMNDGTQRPARRLPRTPTPAPVGPFLNQSAPTSAVRRNRQTAQTSRSSNNRTPNLNRSAPDPIADQRISPRAGPSGIQNERISSKPLKNKATANLIQPRPTPVTGSRPRVPENPNPIPVNTNLLSLSAPSRQGNMMDGNFLTPEQANNAYYMAQQNNAEEEMDSQATEDDLSEANVQPMGNEVTHDKTEVKSTKRPDTPIPQLNPGARPKKTNKGNIKNKNKSSKLKSKGYQSPRISDLQLEDVASGYDDSVSFQVPRNSRTYNLRDSYAGDDSDQSLHRRLRSNTSLTPMTSTPRGSLMD
jgi:hypothetical protein